MNFRQYIKETLNEGSSKPKIKFRGRSDFNAIARAVGYDDFKELRKNMVDVSSEFKTEYAFKLLDGYDDVWVFVDKAFKNSKGRGGDWFAVNEEGEQLDSVLQVDQLRNGDWEKWEWEV